MRNYILKIKDIHISKVFSQKYMADQLNISQQMYSKLEKHDRNITLENLIKISFDKIIFISKSPLFIQLFLMFQFHVTLCIHLL